jgi:NADH dehydrogenase FAD-containing subunit
VIVSPADYMPYTSLLPQVGAGTVDPRHIAVSLSATLRRTRHIPGHAVAADWLNDIIEHRQFVRLGLIPSQYSGLAAAEHTDIYYQTDGQPLNGQRQVSCT